MASPTYILETTIFEDSALYLMARVKGNDGEDITQATIASISLRVLDMSNENTSVHSSSPVVADTVHDTLQTTALDPRWTKDVRGYNFGVTVPASAFPTGDHTYRVEVHFTPVSGDRFSILANVKVLDLLS